MKTLFLLLTGLAAASAQPNIKEFNDCGTLQSVMFIADDLVRIRCDSVYVLNTLTFRRFDSAYRALRSKGTNIANLMNAYDEIIILQQQRIEEQARHYDELRANFSSLSGEAGKRVAESSAKLTTALSSMEGLTRDLTETKKLLGEAREIIEAEQRGFNLDRLLWGIGGVAVGIVAGVLIAR